jgi:hypothetical protein
MGPVTANIQPTKPGEARSVPSASGTQSIAVSRSTDSANTSNTRKLIAAPDAQTPLCRRFRSS